VAENLTGRHFVEKIVGELAKSDAEAAKNAALVYADWLEEKGCDSWAAAWRQYGETLALLNEASQQRISKTLIENLASFWRRRRLRKPNSLQTERLTLAMLLSIDEHRSDEDSHYGPSPLHRAFAPYLCFANPTLPDE